MGRAPKPKSTVHSPLASADGRDMATPEHASPEWPVYSKWKAQSASAASGEFVAVCGNEVEGPHSSLDDLRQAAFSRFGRRPMRFYRVGAEHGVEFETA